MTDENQQKAIYQNWLGWEIQGKTIDGLQPETKARLDAVYNGKHVAPLNLSPISHKDWWHSFRDNVPILQFTVRVKYDKSGNKVEPFPVDLTCFLFQAGHGIAFNYNLQKDHVSYWRFGCKHDWVEKKANTKFDGHRYRCKKCDFEQTVHTL